MSTKFLLDKASFFLIIKSVNNVKGDKTLEDRRFLLDKAGISESQIVIQDREDIHRLKRVLRLKRGAEIIALDGQGKEYEVVLTEILTHRVCGQIVKTMSHPLPELEITLYQSLIKSLNMDLVIHKATELGVSRIQPIITERTVVRVTSINEKQLRWQKIAKSAFLQSCQTRIPVIEPIKSINEAVETGFDLGLVFWEEEQEKGLKGVLNQAKGKKIAILIGPEGGLTLNEVDLARQRGMISVSLGQQRLKSETASIIALSLVRYALE